MPAKREAMKKYKLAERLAAGIRSGSVRGA